jgi:hypothetical protein
MLKASKDNVETSTHIVPEDKQINGTYQVPLTCLSEPPDSMICREINTKFVETLKQKMDIAEYELALPVFPVLLMDTSKEAFDEEDVADYTFYALGYNHLRVALLSTKHDMLVRVQIFVGLSNLEARTIGNDHNSQTHVAHPLAFKDTVRQCRELLYDMAGMLMNEDTPKLSHPWRKACQRMLCKTDKVGN